MFVTDKPFSTSMIYFDENSRRSHDIQHNDSQNKHNEDSNKKIRHSVSILMQSITMLSAIIKSIMLSVVEWVFIETGFNQMACSSNAQFNPVFKTASRISVALLHQKLLMILWE